MINRDLLKSTIDNSGLKLEFIAERCNMTSKTLRIKVQDGNWTTVEVDAFCKTLHLSAADRNKIFFA